MQYAPRPPTDAPPLMANYAQLIKAFNSVDQNITFYRRHRPEATRTPPLCIVIAGTASVILAQGPKVPSMDRRRFIGNIEAAFGSITDKNDFTTAQVMSRIAPGYLPFVFDDLSQDLEQNALIYQHTVERPPCLLWSGDILQIYAVGWDIQLARRIRVAAAWCHPPGGRLRSISERTKEEIRADLEIYQALNVMMHVAGIHWREGRLMFPTRPPSGLYSDEVLLKKEDVDYLQAAWRIISPGNAAFFGWGGLQRI